MRLLVMVRMVAAPRGTVCTAVTTVGSGVVVVAVAEVLRRMAAVALSEVLVLLCRMLAAGQRCLSATRACAEERAARGVGRSWESERSAPAPVSAAHGGAWIWWRRGPAPACF